MKNIKKFLGTALLVSALAVSGCGRPTDGNANNVSGAEKPGQYTIRVAHLIKEEQAGHLPL
ncbi:hypothetical protein [Ammoniphilus sp. YIM 78166]|uniref:hypothetical protein n=1 Tax=Ammoniphilus sp. YIM 78166 TaxID=1644106 RepID=UPI00107054C6|nr:hypothetical protein [Ammoniphilus sp. YIM 78166]